MFGKLQLGRVFGVNLFIHHSFWILPAFVWFASWSAGGIPAAVLDLSVVLAVFGCVVLHELGHAWAASAYGIRTRDITLYPIGGVARLESIPERSWPEIVISLAGPAVNVVIAVSLAMLLVAFEIGMIPHLTAIDSMSAEFLRRLFTANVILVVFNMIPAFPMDGGRILRAALQLMTDRVTATNTAVMIGSVIAGLIFLVAVFTVQPFLMVLAVMVFLLGRAEADAVRAIAEQREQQRLWPTGKMPDSRSFAEVWQSMHTLWQGPKPAPVAHHDGWVWDATNHWWTEYRQGVAVRRYYES